MDRKFKLGQKVVCSAYVKRTGNHFETGDGSCCYYWEKGATEGVLVEDFHYCEKFERVPKPFAGVYVGTTRLCTRLLAEWYDNPYGVDGFRFSGENPMPFAVIYFADNQKRLVPIDAIWSQEEAERINGGELNGRK